ncbi:MAG TPA: ABC transporter permease [Polyangiales bacterium]|nr:ABC transporter permease [Polyangiales bacterium]
MNRSLAMLLAVIKKELRQTARDKRMLFLLVAVPVIQLFIFANAVNLDVDHVPTVVVDLDKSQRSASDLRRLLADGTLTKVGAIDNIPEAERWLETGRAAVVLLFPAGFERDVVRGRRATVQAILDGSDPNRAGIASAAIAQYFGGEAAVLLKSRMLRVSPEQPVRLPQLQLRSRVYFNPELETAVYMVPGIMAMLLLMITTIVTAMGLSRERERGTLEQILVTPVSSSMLMLGKILPFAMFGLIDFAVALVVGSYAFDMPLRGSLSLLLTGTLLYLMTTLGAGMLISTFSGSQQQAFMGGFFFMLPAALLSGIMTPIRSMPSWLQVVTLVNPLRHYAEVLRGVLLRGATAADLQVQLSVLAVIGLVIFASAVFRFRRMIG